MVNNTESMNATVNSIKVNNIRSLKKNIHGRDFVVGDIHGCYDKLMDSLTEVNFDFNTDRLISVGDLIDRGPKSYECLSLLSEKWFHAVRGNHEQMMIDCVVYDVKDGGMWHGNGGTWEMGYDSDCIVDIAAFADLVMPYAIEIEREDGLSVGVVHADVNSKIWDRLKKSDLSFSDHSEIMNLLWGRSRISGKTGWDQDVDGVELMFCGHSVVSKDGSQFGKGEYRKWDHVMASEDNVKVNNVIYTDHGAVFYDGSISLYDLYGKRVVG